MDIPGDSLKSVDQTKAGKWKKYLELKAAFYSAYVSCNMTCLCKVRNFELIEEILSGFARIWKSGNSLEI